MENTVVVDRIVFVELDVDIHPVIVDKDQRKENLWEVKIAIETKVLDFKTMDEKMVPVYVVVIILDF